MRFLAWHLGLGDAIAFAGLAVKLSDGRLLTVPCWPHNEVSVKSIFINHPNIRVAVVRSDNDWRYRYDEVILLGHYSDMWRDPRDNMIEWVYETAAEDVRKRWDDPVVEKAAKVPMSYFVPDGGQIILTHQDQERGFKMDRKLISSGNVVPVFNTGKSILQWFWAIERAEEIHCIDSAILHLVEQLQPTGKLYYHKYARPESEAYKFRHNWTVLE